MHKTRIVIFLIKHKYRVSDTKTNGKFYCIFCSIECIEFVIFNYRLNEIISRIMKERCFGIETSVEYLSLSNIFFLIELSLIALTLIIIIRKYGN